MNSDEIEVKFVVYRPTIIRESEEIVGRRIVSTEEPTIFQGYDRMEKYPLGDIQ